MSKKVKDTEYLFLTASIRAKEARMLTKEKMERMLAEPNFPDAARVLVDCGYEDMSEMNSNELNEALRRHLAAEIEEFYDNVPLKDIAEMFRLKYEYHNAKVVVKNGGLMDSGDKLFSACGRTPIEEIVRIYETEDSGRDVFSNAVVEARETLSRTGNPQLSDFIMDRAYFAELLSLAEESRSPYIMDYVKVLIDSANLRSTVRAILMNRRELLEKALVDGGTLDAHVYLTSVNTREDVAALFSNTIFAAAAEAESMTRFEREADNAVNAYLAGASLRGFGPEPAIAYLAAVENEIMTIRIILSGKLMDIDPEQLRERLRDSYV